MYSEENSDAYPNTLFLQVCEKEAVETLLGPELQRDQHGGYRWIDASSEYSVT